MKKLILKLDAFKETLSKEQMKMFMGGDSGPGDPTSSSASGGDGGGSSPISGGGGYKCCWTGTSNCSRCVGEATSAWYCVRDATLTAC